MDRNSVIRINQARSGPGIVQLRDILKRAATRLFVQGDEDLLFNDIAQLLDAAKELAWRGSGC
jgi:hypothetical protein